MGYSVIINVITEINYRLHAGIFFLNKYNVNTCMYTTSALYCLI